MDIEERKPQKIVQVIGKCKTILCIQLYKDHTIGTSDKGYEQKQIDRKWSEVYSGSDRINSIQFAVKMTNISGNKELNRKSVEAEKLIFQRLMNTEKTYLVEYYRMFTTQNNSYLIMRKYDQNLLQFMLKWEQENKLKTINGQDTQAQDIQLLQKLVYQLACAYYILQQKQILHLDIKATNIFVLNSQDRENIRFIIADFDRSRIAQEVDGKQVGRLFYQAPWHQREQEIKYNNFDDLYGIAIVLENWLKKIKNNQCYKKMHCLIYLMKSEDFKLRKLGESIFVYLRINSKEKDVGTIHRQEFKKLSQQFKVESKQFGEIIDFERRIIKQKPIIDISRKYQIGQEVSISDLE